MKYIVFFIGLLTVGCTVSTPSEFHFNDNPGNISHLQQSTVALVSEENGEITGPHCTAFYVAPRRLATALHCVEDSNIRTIEVMPGLVIQVIEDRPLEPTLGREILFVDFDEQNRIIDNWDPTIQPRIKKSVVIAFDDIEDIAILELNEAEPDSTHWLPIASNVVVGEQVYTMGMPQAHFWIFERGMVSSLRKFPGNRRKIVFQLFISPGASGSPIVNERGEVVAVATQYIPNTGLGIGTPFERLQILFDVGHQTPVELPPKEEAVAPCDLSSCPLPENAE